MNNFMSNTRYNQILATAKVLFWKHGFKRVTVEEICREAGVSKMTYYKFFRNKKEVAKAVYDMVVEKGYEDFKAIMDDKDTSPRQKMEQILLLKLEGTNDISREFLTDFYSNPELGLSEYIEQKTREIWVNVIGDFKKAQEKGWLRKDFKPEGIFLFINRLFDIFEDESAAELYDSPQELVMELSRFFTYGIMPSENSDNRSAGY